MIEGENFNFVGQWVGELKFGVVLSAQIIILGISVWWGAPIARFREVSGLGDSQFCGDNC